ncbi:MBL fold metallo-hydrolase [Cloacibacillus porcorum]|uniref:MBL fold metallo-hydrolase n=1 Tax=Cloacibacillus porcorum TaxID=1197717 RepID=UPI000ABC3B3E|nr:MBL fold metallo-hydrolase [Cloacibacillus porcorum]
MIKILTLMDDASSENKALRSEHGLSFWVEAGDRRFLFDCGSGPATLYNANRLGVSLKDADFTVCSHSHYDHAAGFRDMAEAGFGGKTLYTGAGFWERKYAWNGLKYTDLSSGFGQEFLREHAVTQKICRGLLPLADGCWLVGDFPRVHPFETIPRRFVKGTPPETTADDFSDEICLAMRTERGLVVLVGCSHPGILNMMRHVHEVLKQPIYALFGGTHLVEADEERIGTTVNTLCGMGLSILGLSHCSGNAAEKYLAAGRSVQTCHMTAGDCIAIR